MRCFHKVYKVSSAKMSLKIDVPLKKLNKSSSGNDVLIKFLESQSIQRGDYNFALKWSAFMSYKFRFGWRKSKSYSTFFWVASFLFLN